MNWIELSRERPKTDTPLIVTDFKEYCCVEYIPPNTYIYSPEEHWIVLGCFVLSEYSPDIELNFTPTHFVYIT